MITDNKLLDDLLEENLQVSESGWSHQPPVSISPAEADDLASLLSLAAALRTVEHPQPSQQAARAAGAQFVAFADEMASRNSTNPISRWVTIFRQPLFVPALLFMFLLFIGVGYWRYGPIPAHKSILANLSGNIETVSAGSSEWRGASVGDTLRTGSRIRAGLDGSATLVFFEGSRIILEPGSELVLMQVAGDWGSVLRLKLDQPFGKVLYNIEPLSNDSGLFELSTPSGMVKVSAASFSVNVDPQGKTLVSVDSGSALVSNADVQQIVTAGGTTLTVPGGIPQAAVTPTNQPIMLATSLPEQVISSPPPGSTSSPECTGTDHHPEGQALADEFGVEYNEIMGWFCQGFGFGEIKQAYDLSAQSNKKVSEIFAMKKSGLGWGEIKKQLGDEKDNNGNKDPKDNKEEKDKKDKEEKQDKDKKDNQNKDKNDNQNKDKKEAK